MGKETNPISLVVDIDQTLAGGVVEVHMHYYNQLLGLNMTDQAIQAAKKFRKTFDVPEIMGYRDPEDPSLREKQEAAFQEARAKIRTSPEVHLDLQTLPGSRDGVETLLTTLAEVQDLSYYTVRPHEVKDATQDWLKKHNYPNPENVVICDSPEDKLKRIITNLVLSKPEEERGSVLLVDDSLKDLNMAAEKIANDPEYSDGLKYIVLIGFGNTEHVEGTFYPSTGLRVLSLPSWDQQSIEDVVARI